VKEGDLANRNPMLHERFAHYCEGLTQALRAISAERLEDLVRLLESAYHERRQVFVFRNGGSGSMPSHFACDLNKGVSYGREKRFASPLAI